MKNVWFVLLLFCFRPALCRLKCNPSDNCICLPGQEYEFQCPSKTASIDGFVIHITEDKQILIDCARDIETFNINHLPNITINKIEKFQMRFCPLPENGFKEVIDWFSLKEVNFFQFGSSNLSNILLTKEYFKGLEFVSSLQLNANELAYLEEDVFANTPNLTSLELETNNIILKPNLFKYTPKLKSLDISENMLESIPEGLFKNLEKLELLHLWSNRLVEINDYTFQGLTNLKSLELSSNKIERISENAFKYLANLQRINLSSNKLGYIPSSILNYNKNLELIIMRSNSKLIPPEYLFSNLLFLKEVDLTNCNLTTIPEKMFENSTNIKNLNLSRNKLTKLPQFLFKGLVKLEELHLENNNLEKIGTEYASLKQLKILNLQINQLTEIPKLAFQDLTNLEEINLQKNQIERIDNMAFYSNEKLEKINLSKNKYSGNYNSQFVLLLNVVNIEEVDLSYNSITQINHVIELNNKVHLKSLNLSHNNITHIRVQDLQPISQKRIIDLAYNNISFVDFAYVDIITRNVKDAFNNKDQSYSVISLAHNPIECDCNSYDLVRYFQNDMQPQVKVMFDIKTDDVLCANPPELKDWSVENLPPQLLTCSFEKIKENNTCPEECSCSWRPHDKSVVVDCSDKNFIDFPDIAKTQMIGKMFNQTEMHLEGNSLTIGPKKNLTGYDNITKLYLSYNEIERIMWLPPKLEVLHLDNNGISHLDYDVLNTLNSSSLVNLTLNNNPWRCECEAENVTNFLRQHVKVVDAKDVRCVNSSILLRDLNRNDLCQEWTLVNLVLIIMGILLVTAIVFAVYYRNQQEIKVWLYAHDMCLSWVTEHDLDQDKTFDAFISYSHKDEDFVVQNLLPVLEGGTQPYKLCLHYRNWIPGEFITTQVTKSVLDSRRTLVVLSPNFLESVWGKMEFRTAHTQAMTEGRARVIIVLYGDVDRDKLDDELKTYLKTNTYVEWGDPYFWNKLKYALPHSKVNVSKNNQKIANVMNCIDDKFNLVSPVTASPGTTPPVLALDPSILKKHPLNFVPSREMDTPPAESGTLLVSTCL